MSATTAGKLLRIMKVRLACQDEGVTKPSTIGKELMQTLVHKLVSLESAEVIEVNVLSSEPLIAKYVRVATDEVLAEIYEDKNT